MAAGSAKRIFTGIAVSYERVATILSLGQDPRWRRALVDAIDARPTDRVLDVATGTGMVAQALHDRYGCAVVGLDQSADMLRVARTREGVFEELIEARAERLPFMDALFDHLTFTYLLRYVDDPAAAGELAEAHTDPRPADPRAAGLVLLVEPVVQEGHDRSAGDLAVVVPAQVDLATREARERAADL